MGECKYYLRAEFHTEEEAIKCKEEFNNLLISLVAMNKNFHENRDIGIGKRKNKTIDEQREILKKFDAWILVDESKGYGEDSGNYFVTSFPNMGMMGNYELERKGNILKLVCLVGHSTSWETIVDWLEHNYEAMADYRSEESKDFIKWMGW